MFGWIKRLFTKEQNLELVRVEQRGDRRIFYISGGIGINPEEFIKQTKELLADTAPDPLCISKPRSSHWPKVRKEHLMVQPVCAVCGEKEDLEVHHIKPFHIFSNLELDPNNLITLCNKHGHHIMFGHLGCFTSYNEYVREDCKIWAKKIKERP